MFALALRLKVSEDIILETTAISNGVDAAKTSEALEPKPEDTNQPQGYNYASKIRLGLVNFDPSYATSKFS